MLVVIARMYTASIHRSSAPGLVVCGIDRVVVLVVSSDAYAMRQASSLKVKLWFANAPKYI